MNVKFSASLDKLHEMLQFIHTQATEVGFDDNLASKIEMALEEAVVNIIKYGYSKTNGGTIEITCNHLLNPAGLEVILKDQGAAFDPLIQAPPISANIPIDEKPIGGYGIYLMRKIMDQASYKRVGNSNVLTLIKYLSKPTS